MGDRLEFVDAAGRKSVCEIPSGTVLLGARDGVVHVTSNANAAVLRIVDTARGRRVEPVRPGATVVVSGVELFCKDLVPGDGIAIDGVRATWRPEASGLAPERGTSGRGAAEARRAAAVDPGASSRSSTPRIGMTSRGGVVAAEATRPDRARPRTGPATSKALVLSIVSLAVLLAVVGLRFLDTQVGKHGPDELLAFARIQFDSGQFERTLATLAEAEQKASADPRITAAAAQLREQVRLAQRQVQRTQVLERGRADFETLRSFVERYGQDPLQRPAARAIVRQCDGWSVEHEGSLRGFAEGDALLAQVAALRGRAESKAAMATPDTVEDAVFAARTHLRFVVREYRAAVAVLETFLRANPGDARAQRELEAIRGEAAEWLASQRAALEQATARGERDAARQKLAQIERHALLPECEAEFAAVRDALAQRLGDAPR